MGIEAVQPQLGERLRAARQARGLKLAEVAEATGISISFLSLVETAKSDLTISRLARLCVFYGLRLADVLPPGVDPQALVVHPGESPTIAFPEEGVRLTLLGPPDAQMTPLVLEFEPGSRYAERVTVDLEVFLLVVEGSLEVEVGGREPETLSAGDSLYLRPSEPHVYRNPDPVRPARAVTVAGPLPGTD